MGQTIVAACFLSLCLAGLLKVDHVTAENMTSHGMANDSLPNDAKITYKILDQIDRYSPVTTVNLSVPVNCMLKAEDETTLQILQNYLSENVKLVIYRLSIRKNPIQIQDRKSLMYQPYHWVRSTGRHGTGLLLLRPEYKAYSLFTLSYGVKTMQVNLIDKPVNCASQVWSETLEYLVRNLLLVDFQNISSADTKTVNQEELVCNMHMVNKSGTAYFRYHCCRRYEASLAECRYLESDLWRKVLEVVIILLKIIVVVFAPTFAPTAMYHLKKIALSYTYKLQNEVKLKTVVTSDKEQYILFKRENATVVEYSHIQGMKKFCKTLKKMKKDDLYVFTLSDIKLTPQESRLIPDNSYPVGFFSVLYSALFRCNIRNKKHLKHCCKSSVICRTKYREGGKYKWYTCLRKVMSLVFAVLLALPWIIRLIAYFTVEKEEITKRKDFAKDRDLDIYFPGTVTLYLTPIHVVFICTYVLLVMDSCLYGVVSTYSRERLRFVLRKCFQDMYETPKLERVGWMFSWILWPCAEYGLLGLVVGPFYIIPCLLCTIATLLFYMLPTVNITFRLLGQFFYNMFPKGYLEKTNFCRWLSNLVSENKEKITPFTSRLGLVIDKNARISTLKRLKQLIVIFVCLLSFYSILFLCMELTTFIVEIFVYTIIGLILNAGQVLTFVSFLVLLGVYARDSFGNVNDSYQEYNKALHKAILKRRTKDVQQTLAASKNPVAFRVTSNRVNTDRTSTNEVELCNRDGFLRWSTKSLLLFIGLEGRPMIPTDFFFNACHMKYYNVPRSAAVRYLRATLEFIIIIIFLLFVMLVVLAFGDTYKLSVTTQVLATLAGGFLPFALKNVVFRSFRVSPVDVEDIYFTACLENEMDTFRQEWPVDDIEVKPEPGNNRTNASIEETQHSNLNEVQEDAPSESTSNTVITCNLVVFDRHGQIRSTSSPTREESSESNETNESTELKTMFTQEWPVDDIEVKPEPGNNRTNASIEETQHSNLNEVQEDAPSESTNNTVINLVVFDRHGQIRSTSSPTREESNETNESTELKTI